MAQPELCGSEFEHGEEVCGVLFVARGEASEVFDPVEKPFDAVTCAIEHRAEAGFPAAMHHWRDVGCGTGIWSIDAGKIIPFERSFYGACSTYKPFRR